MLWNKNKHFELEPFELEKDLEEAILEISPVLFGEHRIYFDIKKKIGATGKKRNIPDGYLLDLTSTKEPKLYVVENELSSHESIKHIAVQVLEFSLAYDAALQLVKSIVKEAISSNEVALDKCNEYVEKNNYENIDYLLESIIYAKESFNALVIIDEVSEELEKALMSQLNFPVEILTIQRYVTESNERLYLFEPFFETVSPKVTSGSDRVIKIDPSEFDTVVVPAREDGFNDVFIDQNCWHSIRIHSSMIPKIKHIAAYRVYPVSAITHIATVKSIEQWNDSNKYVLYFTEPAKEIGPLPLVPKSTVIALRAPRYTTREKLEKAKNLDEAF